MFNLKSFFKNFSNKDIEIKPSLSDYLLKKAEREPAKRQEYLVEVYWLWGGGELGTSLKEKHQFHSWDKNTIKEDIDRFIVRMTRHYSFDCSRLEYPLHPSIYNITVTPIMDSENMDEKEFNLKVEEEVKKTEEHIKNKTLYTNSGYNLD